MILVPLDHLGCNGNMLKRTASLLKKFRASQNGNMTVIGAVLGVPVLIGAIGLSVDYSMGTNNRTSMQNSLDAAVWQTARLDPNMTKTEMATELQKFYAANGGLGSATVDTLTTTATHVMLATSASFDMKTTAMGIAGVKNVRITTKAAAQLPYKLTSATFSVTKQSGWWAKSIRLFGRPEGQTKYKQLMRIVYGGKKVGSSNYNPNYKYVNNASGAEVAVTNDPVIDLANIESLYLSMTIDASAASLSESGFADVVMPMTIESDDPALVQRMFVSKTSGSTTTFTQNDSTDIYGRLRCGETEKHSWEDGGSLSKTEIKPSTNPKKYKIVEGSYPSSNSTLALKAAQSDFDYTITGRCTYTADNAYMTQ